MLILSANICDLNCIPYINYYMRSKTAAANNKEIPTLYESLVTVIFRHGHYTYIYI